MSNTSDLVDQAGDSPWKNIAKGTTDPRVEFISIVITQSLIKHLIKHKLPNLNQRSVSRLSLKGWLAIAKLKPHSLFISLLSMLKKAFYNVKIGK